MKESIKEEDFTLMPLSGYVQLEKLRWHGNFPLLRNILKKPTRIQAYVVFADTQSPNKKPK